MLFLRLSDFLICGFSAAVATWDGLKINCSAFVHHTVVIGTEWVKATHTKYLSVGSIYW